MEKEPYPFFCKLTNAVSKDYPDAVEIRFDFEDAWYLVEHIKQGQTKIYVAARDLDTGQPRPDRFEGLTSVINLKLFVNRLYNFFEPWPLPPFEIVYDDETGLEVGVEKTDPKVQLNHMGQAQAWRGYDVAVIWESYLSKLALKRYDQGLINQLWNAIEDDLMASKIFIRSYEPRWEQGYTDFLVGLDYGPDPQYSEWWSKERATRA